MVRRLLLLLIAFAAVSVVATRALAQYEAPNYSIERWDEDYSYLNDPASRTDPFDSLKYIPLGDRGDWYLSLGGQARARFDCFNNTGFGQGKQSEQGFELVRLLANADLHFGPNLRAFLQFNSGLEYDRYGGPRPGDADDFDIQQGFVDVNFPLDDSKSMLLRVGRQELIYGAQRLISPNDWANVRRTFEGLKLSLSLPGDTLDVFVVQPVEIDKAHFNSGQRDTLFAGLYNVMALPDLLPSAGAKLDLYLLDQDRNRSSQTPVDAATYTLGVRPHARPAPWDFDVEADWQFGYYGPGTICAWSIASEAGYTFDGVRFSPRLSAGLDVASGSANPAERFNQLYPPQYLFLGHMYLFGRENIIDAHAGLALHLSKDVTFNADQHFFFRQNVHDAIYNLNDEVVRTSDGSHAADIGSETDLVVNWQIERHWSAYVGYAHFFTGPFLIQTGAHDDQDFFYAAVTFTF